VGHRPRGLRRGAGAPKGHVCFDLCPKQSGGDGHPRRRPGGRARGSREQSKYARRARIQSDRCSQPRCHRARLRPRFRRWLRRVPPLANGPARRLPRRPAARWMRRIGLVAMRQRRKSSTFRRLGGNRTHMSTTRRITSGDEWKFGMDWLVFWDEACLFQHPNRLSPARRVCFASTRMRCAARSESPVRYRLRRERRSRQRLPGAEHGRSH